MAFTDINEIFLWEHRSVILWDKDLLHIANRHDHMTILQLLKMHIVNVLEKEFHFKSGVYEMKKP